MADLPPSDTLRQAVYWAYLHFLGRPPDSDLVVDEHIRTLESPTVDAVSKRFQGSDEYAQRVGAFRRDPTGVDLSAFRDPATYPRVEGVYRDIFGIGTRLSYLPPLYARYSGRLPGDDGTDLLPMHDAVELTGMVEAGRCASGTLTVMELGAGWGPWVSIGAKMAERRGLDYRLIAVEGSAEHFRFLQTHMADNGIDPARCRLVHGVVGATDGTARFPIVVNASLDYGASADGAATGTGEFETLERHSIASLLGGEPIVDVIHCDIQGHEVEALGAAIGAMTARVRRLVVGTHGRAIEQDLHRLFAEAGWRLDRDLACLVRTGPHALDLVQDGAQLWSNPNLT